MSLSLSVCSQSGPPICTSFWAIFRALRALRALKGPRIKFSHSLMHRPYRDLQNLKFSCLYLFPFSHKVVPQKASGRGAVYHTSIVHISRKTQSVPPARKDTGSSPSFTFSSCNAVTMYQNLNSNFRNIGHVNMMSLRRHVMLLRLRNDQIRIPRQILRQNTGLTFILSQS